MTETERKALAWVNEVLNERYALPAPGLQRRTNSYHEAICRAIERIEELEATDRDYAKPLMELQAEFEAFKREVSDAVEAYSEYLGSRIAFNQYLQRFILPQPDPLVEAWLEAFPGNHIDDAREECAKISAALAARGLEIREVRP